MRIPLHNGFYMSITGTGVFPLPTQYITIKKFKKS
jgi:hypothetical protein